ncbi:sugar phosphate isomerase/epimerase family protein [Halosimplex amylolyticum]|uniref:sugar phosphate isomerase/epimerase family protein n=1 Tax=Halosimplex amylolyticum TaxID=3396616 RepID=UPI003F564C1A
MDSSPAGPRAAASQQSATAADRDQQTVRTGIQLHTLRDLDASLPETIRRVGEAGFDGVEFAGTLEDADLDAVESAMADSGVEAAAAHVDWPTLRDDFDGVVERYARVGCHRLVNPHLGIDQVISDRAVRDTADELARMGARLANRGVEFYYHNAPHDLRPQFRDDRLGGVLSLGPIPALVGDRATNWLDRVAHPDPDSIADRTALGQIYARTVDRSLRFEIDVGSVAMAGYRPDTVLDLVGDKLDLIHLTEGADVESTMQAARRNDVEWVIYEDDHPDDPAAALRRGAEALADR